ncbi:hypothetical protein NOCARDAX2BIS_540013 [Nocardioides sp. AX2bis]|nr:hypothetical protein NOCARDAX2BIS_540013 [Nocardioides sp. AX2bis]
MTRKRSLVQTQYRPPRFRRSEAIFQSLDRCGEQSGNSEWASIDESRFRRGAFERSPQTNLGWHGRERK